MATAYGLNYDKNNDNGIIFNDNFKGNMFKGRKPVLSFDYLQFIYREKDAVHVGSAEMFLIALVGDTTYRPMTVAEKEEIRAKAIAWTQLEGEEGNPDLAQSKAIRKGVINKAFNDALLLLTGSLAEGEQTSWLQQEKEARAFVIDNLTPTPMLSSMIVSRGLGETVLDLATIVIAKADAYIVAYGSLLGKQQGKIKAIDGAATKTIVEAVAW